MSAAEILHDASDETLCRCGWELPAGISPRDEDGRALFGCGVRLICPRCKSEHRFEDPRGPRGVS